MPPTPPSPKTALAVGCTAHIVQDGLTAATYVLMPVLAQAFGFTYAQVGLIKGLKSLTQGACSRSIQASFPSVSGRDER